MLQGNLAAHTGRETVEPSDMRLRMVRIYEFILSFARWLSVGHKLTGHKLACVAVLKDKCVWTYREKTLAFSFLACLCI